MYVSAFHLKASIEERGGSLCLQLAPTGTITGEVLTHKAKKTMGYQGSCRREVRRFRDGEKQREAKSSKCSYTMREEGYRQRKKGKKVVI